MVPGALSQQPILLPELSKLRLLTPRKPRSHRARNITLISLAACAAALLALSACFCLASCYRRRRRPAATTVTSKPKMPSSSDEVVHVHSPKRPQRSSHRSLSTIHSEPSDPAAPSPYPKQNSNLLARMRESLCTPPATCASSPHNIKATSAGRATPRQPSGNVGTAASVIPTSLAPFPGLRVSHQSSSTRLQSTTAGPQRSVDASVLGPGAPSSSSMPGSGAGQAVHVDAPYTTATLSDRRNSASHARHTGDEPLSPEKAWLPNSETDTSRARQPLAGQARYTGGHLGTPRAGQHAEGRFWHSGGEHIALMSGHGAAEEVGHLGEDARAPLAGLAAAGLPRGLDDTSETLPLGGVMHNKCDRPAGHIMHARCDRLHPSAGHAMHASSNVGAASAAANPSTFSSTSARPAFARQSGSADDRHSSHGRKAAICPNFVRNAATDNSSSHPRPRHSEISPYCGSPSAQTTGGHSPGMGNAVHKTAAASTLHAPRDSDGHSFGLGGDEGCAYSVDHVHAPHASGSHASGAGAVQKTWRSTDHVMFPSSDPESDLAGRLGGEWTGPSGGTSSVPHAPPLQGVHSSAENTRTSLTWSAPTSPRASAVPPPSQAPFGPTPRSEENPILPSPPEAFLPQIPSTSHYQTGQNHTFMPPAHPPAGYDGIFGRFERSRAHFSSHITQVFDKTVAIDPGEMDIGHAEIVDMLDDLYSARVKFKGRCALRCVHQGSRAFVVDQAPMIWLKFL
jgi:hypothetical protein